MSISPTDGNRSVSLAASPSPPRNPSLGHGRDPQGPRHRSRHRRQPGGRAAAPAPDRSLAAAAADPASEIFVGPVPAIGVGGYSVGSSSSVTCSDALTHTSERILSSEPRSDGLSSASSNGKLLGPVDSQYCDNLKARSTVPHGNTSQSASRRNNAVNANHLLSFYYEPIPVPSPKARTPPPRRQRKIKPFNRDLFLQANFKFVVLDTGNYLSEASIDPDRMLQWDDVVCVRYSTPSLVQCPICLETPLCPQITLCGHIYCFACILQYLLLGEEDNKRESWKKCPLCFMMISTRNLYTVHIDSVQQLNVVDLAHFTLLTRAKDSLVPSLKIPQGEEILSVSNDALCDTFSKFIVTSDVELSVRDSKLDLNQWLEKSDSGLVDDIEKLPYVCAALELLEERMKSWLGHHNVSGSPVESHISPPVYLKAVHNASNLLTPPSSSASPISVSSDAHDPVSSGTIMGLKNEFSGPSDKLVAEDLLPPNTVTPSSERDSYTFYQATDGQHLILHPLNMKCLLHHYGSYDTLPSRISGRILEMETVTQTEAMRRRYRYLSHFSLTTTFMLCEIDMSDILPSDSLAPFMDEIKKRQKQRQRLARKEEDEKNRAEIAAALDVPAMSDRRYSSSTSYPVFSLDDFEALGGSGPPSTSPPVVSERKLFSNVTRLGYAAAHDSPSLVAERSTASSGIHTEFTGGETSAGPKVTNALSFAAIISSAKEADPAPQQIAGGCGKKGKKPTRVLLSTAGGRRY